MRWNPAEADESGEVFDFYLPWLICNVEKAGPPGSYSIETPMVRPIFFDAFSFATWRRQTWLHCVISSYL